MIGADGNGVMEWIGGGLGSGTIVIWSERRFLETDGSHGFLSAISDERARFLRLRAMPLLRAMMKQLLARAVNNQPDVPS